MGAWSVDKDIGERVCSPQTVPGQSPQRVGFGGCEHLQHIPGLAPLQIVPRSLPCLGCLQAASVKALNTTLGGIARTQLLL